MFSTCIDATFLGYQANSTLSILLLSFMVIGGEGENIWNNWVRRGNAVLFFTNKAAVQEEEEFSFKLNEFFFH